MFGTGPRQPVGANTGAVANMADKSDEGAVAEATVQSRRHVLRVAGGAAIGAVAATIARSDPASANVGDAVHQGENHDISPVVLDGVLDTSPYDALVSIHGLTGSGKAA